MKKIEKTILAIIGIILLTASLNSVAAAVYPYREYTFDLKSGESYYRNYNYADYYGYPAYQVYSKELPYYKKTDTSKYFPSYSYKEKLRTARFLVKSYNYRYDLTSGKTSAAAFCHECQTDNSYSSFGAKPAYDPRVDGIDGDYYKPTFDVNTQTYNWRF